MSDFRGNKLFLLKENCSNSGNNIMVQQLQKEGDGYQFILVPENIRATTTTTTTTTTTIATTAGSLFFNILEDEIIQ
jgi:hypothetical protein